MCPSGTPGGDHGLPEAASKGELMRGLESLLEDDRPSTVQPDRSLFQPQAKSALPSIRSPRVLIRIGIPLCAAWVR
jgi:hypothetical protein